MKKLNFIVLSVLVLAASFTALAQQKMHGTVIDVLDGKTIVIDMKSMKMTAVLQHIEVPEPEQPLCDVVKEHLRQLVIGKTVMFRPVRILHLRTEGQLTADGMDISQQMLRDGAAWLMPVAMSGQDEAEFALYQEHEATARSEKRGVWSIANMKTAWEFRADVAARKKEAEKASAPTQPVKYVEQKVIAKKTTAGNIGALLNEYNSETKMGYLATPYLAVSGLPEGRKMMVSIAYMYKEDAQKHRNGEFGISVQSAAEDWQFLTSNNMFLMADGAKISIGKPKRDARKFGDLKRERLTYAVTRSTMEKIANSNEVYLVTGKSILIPSYGLQLILFNLLDVAK